MTLSEINSYVQHVLTKPKVQGYLDNKQYTLFMPKVSIVNSCGPLYAAMTYGHGLIEVSSWLLVDKDETLRTLRHECAHVLKNKCSMPGSAHGRGFTQALKMISPRLWRRDKFWHPNDKIEDARLLMHPKSKTLI